MYNYFLSVFCILSKKSCCWKYRKWGIHLKNRCHYAKMVKNARIDYCTLFFLQKEASLALAAVLCNGMVGCIMNMRLSALKYCQYHSGQKLLKHSNKVYCLLKPNKCITTIDFRLASAIFINLEHVSHPTLVLLFKFWEGNCCWA